MTTCNLITSKDLWFKQPVMWVFAGVITLTILWTTCSFTIAIIYRDSIVNDDYYQNGRLINQDFILDKNASSKLISSKITINLNSLQIFADINAQINSWPQRLKLSFSSAAFPEQDQNIILIRKQIDNNHNSMHYTGQLQAYPSGTFYMQISTETLPLHATNVIQNPLPWRLKKTITMSKNTSVIQLTHE